jgi:hypothetical protein
MWTVCRRSREELSDYIAALTPEDVERIQEDVSEFERMGLLPKPKATP